MKRCILIAVTLALVSPAGAEDWPRWRGPAGTGHVPAGVAVPATLPAEPKIIWTRKVGAGLASPVVSGKRLFHLDNYGGKELVGALDADSGKALWNVTLDKAFQDVQTAPGPRCTPVVDRNRLYVQSCRGEFQCLNTADGKVIWRTNFVKDFGAVFIGERGRAMGASRHGYCGSPLVDGDRIIVGVGGKRGASVVCFNKLNGKVIWKSQNDTPGYCGPVIATIAGVRQIISFTATAVIGLDADKGTLLWRTPVKTALGRHITTPVIVGDIVVVSSHQAGLIGIRVSRTAQSGAFTAERAWVAKGSAAINFSSPVAVGNFLYGLGRIRTLICIDVRTGRKAWAKDLASAKTFKKGHASFIVMKDNILVLAENGELLLIAAEAKALRIISRVKVCGKTWCSPAYVGGRLFVRDIGELRCVQLIDKQPDQRGLTTWKLAMDVALAAAKAGRYDYIIDHMLAPSYVKELVAKYGKQDWKKEFQAKKLRDLPYYYSWLRNGKIEVVGNNVLIRGKQGCYANFIKIDGKYSLGDFGQKLTSM